MTVLLKFGLFGLHKGTSTDPATLVRLARMAEEVGFESLWVGDHVALPAWTPEAAGNPAFQPRLEAVVALAFLAAVTNRVRLAAGVIVLPQRHPVLVAKQLSSLDVLSRGRLTVGLGIGYLGPELQTFGVSLAERGMRMDEYLAAMLTLWDEPTPKFAGRFVSFADVVQRPRPDQKPHPPIVFGGHSAAALQRAVERGNGWYGWDLGLTETAEALVRLSQIAAQCDRPPDLGPLEITITPPGTVDIATARRYADLGVHRLALEPNGAEVGDMESLINRVGEDLVGRVSASLN